MESLNHENEAFPHEIKGLVINEDSCKIIKGKSYGNGEINGAEIHNDTKTAAKNQENGVVLEASSIEYDPFDSPTLKIEVASARVVEKESQKKHVAYTIMIHKESSQPDPNPAVIERRYTDFLELYEAMKRDFPEQMNGVIFPKKVLLGNFGPGVISSRCAGFEHLLQHITSKSVLLESTILTDFLQGPEQREAFRWMENRRYEQALPLLENIFCLLNKLYTDRHPMVLLALCRLVACSYADKTSDHHTHFADIALHRFEAVSDCDLLCFYVPLLQLCVNLWWSVGRDKHQLEARLSNFKRRGFKVDGCPSLLDAIMNRDRLLQSK